MYFEKCIKNYNNSKLIRLSQLRRNFIRNMHADNFLHVVLEYYNAFCDLLEHKFQIQKHPLFEWNQQNSTCFLFEKINIQQILSDQYVKEATRNQPIEA